MPPPIGMDSMPETLANEITTFIENIIQQRGIDGRSYGTSYVALGDTSHRPANARHCERCGEWATDYEQPEPVSVLMRGCHIGGHFYCDACEFTVLESLEQNGASNESPGHA
jgi:hypothetical protein